MIQYKQQSAENISSSKETDFVTRHVSTCYPTCWLSILAG